MYSVRGCVEVVEVQLRWSRRSEAAESVCDGILLLFYFVLLYCDIIDTIENRLHWLIQIIYCLVKNIRFNMYLVILGNISTAQDQLQSKDQLSSNTYKDGMKQTFFIMKQKEKGDYGVFTADLVINRRRYNQLFRGSS